jgi:hypothetical protein
MFSPSLEAKASRGGGFLWKVKMEGMEVIMHRLLFLLLAIMIFLVGACSVEAWSGD